MNNKPLHPVADLDTILSHLQGVYFPPPSDAVDLYTRLNLARDWFNTHVQGFALILEDVWNETVEGQTTIDYQLRSLTTKDESLPLGSDVYANRRDANGVWHLEAYQYSVLWVDAELSVVRDFLLSNAPNVS
jgi:hypothetical protein